MRLDDPHPIWPEGPDCDEQCPGKWSQYHDGFAWGYEKAQRDERARIRAAVEDWACDGGYLCNSCYMPRERHDADCRVLAVLRIIDASKPASTKPVSTDDADRTASHPDSHERGAERDRA